MKEKGIPIFWEDNDELETKYVNHMFVAYGKGDFYIVFGELSPIVRNENTELPEKVFVKPMSRIALTKESMKEFLDVLNKYYKTVEEKKKDA